MSMKKNSDARLLRAAKAVVRAARFGDDTMGFSEMLSRPMRELEKAVEGFELKGTTQPCRSRTRNSKKSSRS